MMSDIAIAIYVMCVIHLFETWYIIRNGNEQRKHWFKDCLAIFQNGQNDIKAKLFDAINRKNADEVKENQS